MSEDPKDRMAGLGVADGDDAAAVSRVAPTDTAEGDEERPPAGVDDLCRLNVCGPAGRMDLAVPARVPLIDLLPAMIGHLGDDLADTGLEHGGWVLQKLGESPLPEELSIAALGLHDGETVYLRPRAEQLPPLDFDDLIDGIAVGIAARPDRWRPEVSRKTLTWLAAIPLAAGLAPLAGHRGWSADLIAAAAAAVLLALAAVAARNVRDAPVAGVLGAAAIAYAALAGALLPFLASDGGRAPLGWAALRPALLGAAAAAAVTVFATAAALGGRRPAFAAAAAVACWITAAAALAAGFRLGLAPAAGVALAPLLPVSGWIPLLSFRLAGMRLDPLPTTPDELQSDLDPLPGQRVTEQTRLADRYQGALHWGLAAVAALCLVPLAVAHGWPARAVTLDAAVAMLLHARVLASARQRLAVILPATGALAVLTVAAGLSSPNAWTTAFGASLIAGVLLLAAALTLPGRKLVPHWGWAGDIFQTLTTVALFPLVLWLLNVFSYARMRG